MKEKLRLSFNVFIELLIFFIISLLLLNQESLVKYFEAYHKKLNFILIIEIFIIIVFYTVNYIFYKKYNTKYHSFNNIKLIHLLIAALIIFPAVFTVIDYFYFPKPPEDKLVVAISPFFYKDKYGHSFSDSKTASDFKKKLEDEVDLDIKVIMLDNPIYNSEEAKYQGKRVGAHLVLYAEEIESMMGLMGEIEYHILPLPIISDSMLLLSPSENINLEKKQSFYMKTEEIITVVESIKENVSSTIYIIGGIEKYRKSNFSSAVNYRRLKAGGIPLHRSPIEKT